MTERLYYTDAYLQNFSARLLDSREDGRVVYLNCTAFYPTSGGQPHDLGTLNGIPVLEVIDEEDRIAHRLAEPLSADTVEGAVDWTRRFDHMQQHTGQHLLSAVLEALFAAKTVSFHLGAESSTIDLAVPSLTSAQLAEAELRANAVIWENRAVRVSFESAASVEGLRKPSERDGDLRIVSIEGCDRSACGGTHVRATGEIGALTLRKLDKVRGNLRLEFLCGARALRRARADYDALSAAARAFSAPLDEVPALVAAQQEQLKEAAKQLRKFTLEQAANEGRALLARTAPGPGGLRVVVERHPAGPAGEELRARAQAFCSGEPAVFAAIFAQPPSLLLASSESSGFDAGARLKALAAQFGGRGGGNARLAQGSFPAPLDSGFDPVA